MKAEWSPEPPCSVATQLVRLADGFTYFHDAHRREFVRLKVEDHDEIYPVNSTSFRHLLAHEFYKLARKTANRNAIADAIMELQGRALYDSGELPVHLRVAEQEGNILIDLCDAKWRVIEVTSSGWQILDQSPVAFIRTGASRPLPMPVAGGSIEPLWDLLNVTPDQRPLVAGALHNFFNPHGPYFVLHFVGEQGTAKSCASKIIRSLVDPNDNPLRSPPREERDLLAQANSNWCIALENLSYLPDWLSDGLCRLSTGGGHSARTLYTDLDEISLAVKRPVIINGIEDVATRPDLAERTLSIELETIPDEVRLTEKKLWAEFEAVQEIIFGGILNALVRALRDLPSLSMKQLPRMADAALWASAGEPAFGFSRGAFIDNYWQNIAEAAVAALEASPVGTAIVQLVDQESEWSGQPSELLEKLNCLVPDEVKRSKAWPKLPRALSGRLNRLAQALRRAGISYKHGRTGPQRWVTVRRVCKSASFASSPMKFASPFASPPASPDDANEIPDDVEEVMP
jgi:hypothetical protein